MQRSPNASVSMGTSWQKIWHSYAFKAMQAKLVTSLSYSSFEYDMEAVVHFSLFVIWSVTFPALVRILSSFAHMVLVIVVHSFEMTQCSKLCTIARKYNTHRLMKTLIKVVVCWWELRAKSLNSTHITYPSYCNVHLYTYTCAITFVDRVINVFNQVIKTKLHIHTFMKVSQKNKSSEIESRK